MSDISPPPWFRRRGYPHFDQPIKLVKAQKIVSNPTEVARHSFYPFIKFTVETVKIKFNRIDLKVEKQTPKIRCISYASHVDSHIYAYYSFLLSKQYEGEIKKLGLTENVIAFRSLGKNNIDFASRAFKEITERKNCHVLCLDVKGFFDNLDHQLLKSAWSQVLQRPQLAPDHYAVFKSLTQFATVDRDKVYQTLHRSTNNMSRKALRLCTPEEFRIKIRNTNLIEKNGVNKKGIPQGSPISALLSNIYMLNFDKNVKEHVETLGGFYFRYCDDMLIIVPIESKEYTYNFIKNEIDKIKLEFQDSKTEQINFKYKLGKIEAERPLQYLGFLFDGNQILLRSASLARYSERMRKGVRLAKSTMAKRNRARQARNEITKPLFKKNIYQRYTHLGRRNFLSYGYKASKIMDSKGIKRQLGRLWNRVQNEINR